MRSILSCGLTFLFFSLAYSLYGQKKDARAILFSNSSYMAENGFEALDESIGDAVVLMREFRRLNVDTCIRRKNFSTRDDFFLKLKYFLIDCKRDGIAKVIVYYAGHGVQAVGGEPFLVPIRFQNTTEQIINNIGSHNELYQFVKAMFDQKKYKEFHQFQYLIDDNIVKGCVPVDEILDSLRDFDGLVITDACRSKVTALARSGNGIPTGIIDAGLLYEFGKRNFGVNAKRKSDSLVSEWQAFYPVTVERQFNLQRYWDSIRFSEESIKSIGLVFPTTAGNVAWNDPNESLGLFTNCFIRELGKFPNNASIAFTSGFWSNVTGCMDLAASHLDDTVKHQKLAAYFPHPERNVFVAPNLVYVAMGPVPARKAIDGGDTMTLPNGRVLKGVYKLSFPSKRLDAWISMSAGSNPNDLSSIFEYKFHFDVLDSNNNIITNLGEQRITINGADAVNNSHYVDTGISQDVLKNVYILKLTVDSATSRNRALALGQEYGGGVIFHIDASGKHGLIAGANDIGNAVPWTNGKSFLIGKLNPSDGKANTNQIILNLGDSGYYAAKLCKDYKGGGYDDWYLPSASQLWEMYLNRDLIGNFSTNCNDGNFLECSYWSSSQIDDQFANNIYFTKGVTWSNFVKSALCPVRPIRSF